MLQEKKKIEKKKGKIETDIEKIKYQSEEESKDSPIEQGLYESIKEEAKKRRPSEVTLDREKIKNVPEGESKDSPLEQGLYESVKDEAKSKDQNEQKFKGLLKRSQEVILKISSVFPLDLFPDQITIDFNKVNIVIRSFFGSHRVHSVLVENISDVSVDTSPFFSTLVLNESGNPENPIKVKYLNNRLAIKARRIIQGLVLAKKQGIDIASLEIPDKIEKLVELGKTTEVKEEPEASL